MINLLQAGQWNILLLDYTVTLHFWSPYQHLPTSILKHCVLFGTHITDEGFWTVLFLNGLVIQLAF